MSNPLLVGSRPSLSRDETSEWGLRRAGDEKEGRAGAPAQEGDDDSAPPPMRHLSSAEVDTPRVVELSAVSGVLFPLWNRHET